MRHSFVLLHRQDMNEPASFPAGSVKGCLNNRWNFPLYKPSNQTSLTLHQSIYSFCPSNLPSIHSSTCQQSVHVSIFPSIHLSIYPPIHLPNYSSIHPSIHQSIFHPSTNPPKHLSIHLLKMYTHAPIDLSVHLSIPPLISQLI